jgi:hypothetical protein
MNVPDGSIYFWMYTMGLKHVDLPDVLDAVRAAGKNVRDKDVQNYWNGFYRSDLYSGNGRSAFELRAGRINEETMDFSDLSQFPLSPYGMYEGEPQERWVPCNKANKPMIKWSRGCLSLVDAQAFPGQVYLAENNKAMHRIIVDCDGDHGEGLDLEVILFLSRWLDKTRALVKQVHVDEVPGYEETGLHLPVSFHLEFYTDRIIPTMHWPGIDIIGNKVNSLRYIKTKEWNGLEPARLQFSDWREIHNFGRRRKHG